MTALTFGGLGKRREKIKTKQVKISIPRRLAIAKTKDKKKIGQPLLQGASSRS